MITHQQREDAIAALSRLMADSEEATMALQNKLARLEALFSEKSRQLDSLRSMQAKMCPPRKDDDHRCAHSETSSKFLTESNDTEGCTTSTSPPPSTSPPRPLPTLHSFTGANDEPLGGKFNVSAAGHEVALQRFTIASQKVSASIDKQWTTHK